MAPLRPGSLLRGFLPPLLPSCLLLVALLPGCTALGMPREAAVLPPFRRGPARDRMEDLGLGCPPRQDLLPCVCAVRASQIHVTCENSELDKIVAAMEILMKMVHKVEELTLMGNRIHLLPGRIFGSLQINKLFLINNELMGITRNAFAGLESSLQHIYIKDPGLYDIPFDTLDNLANLRTCVLEDTDIIEIPRLYSLSKLEFLKIDGSRVSSIPSAAFRFMPNMKKVHISNSLLKEVKGNALEGLVYLKEVNFSNNIIDWIHPRAFRTLNAVEHLSLAGNSLSDASMAVLAAREMRELRILDMSRNKIVELKKGTFVDMPNIRTINLSENLISKIDHGAFFRLPSVRKLDISGNAIGEFHADIFTESSNLEHLSVASNNLTFVAEMRYIARSLPNLRSLDISKNLLKVDHPRAFEGHPKLEALKIDRNRIERLQPGTFKGLPNLRELYLSHNLISSEYSEQLWNLPKLRVLDMSHNELRKIDVSLFEGLPHVSSVDLSFNLITEISAEAFLGSPQVKNLNVSFNSIGFLSENVFHVLTELFELEMSFNELTVLSGGLFKGLTKLEYLHVTHNQITTVEPGTFRDTGSLQYLDLSANFIQELPSEALSKLASLRVLKLNRNAINKVQDSYLSGLKAIEHLDLSNNHIQAFNPAAFTDMTHLRDVDLSVNYIQSLHPDMFSSTKLLEKLNISHNYISSIGHEAFVNLKKLRILDLTNNSLTDLGDAVIDFPDLQALFLSENYINSLKNLSFAGLPSLSVLHFKNNGLQTFETTAFHGLRSLVYLDLRNNNLVELNPESFVGLTSLQEMQISKNQISVVKDFSFSDLTALRSLELQDNVITEVGGRAFFNLPTMKFLNLSRNGLQDVPEDALGRIPSLDVLDLSSNYILEIKDSSFYRLEWLTVLMMHDNDLCRMSPGAFARQRALRILTLNNNQLKRLHLHALGNTIKGLSLLDMSGNPFRCDCEMVWLREYLGEPPEPGRAQRTSILGDSLKGVPVCASPEEYKGIPITEVPVTAFLCGGRRSPDEVDDICVPRFLDPLLFTGGSPGSLDPGTINTLLHLTNLSDAIPQADTGPSYLDYSNPIHVPSAPGLVALASVIDETTSSSSTSTAASTSTAPTTAAVSAAGEGVATVAPTVSQAVRSNQSEQLLSSSNIHTVTGDTPTIYAGSAGHTDDNKQQQTGLFSGIKLPTLPNLIESITNLNLPQLGLNVNWGNIPVIGRQDTGFLGKSGSLGKPMKGPDVSDPIWVDGPSSPHPLFPNPPSPPPPKEVPPPLIPDKNPSRGPHPVSGPGASFVFPTSQGERLRPGVPGVVVPVTRPTNIWAVRPQPGGQPGGQPGRQPGGQPGRQPGRPKPGSAQGPGSGQQKRPHQVSFRPGSPILPSVTYVGPGPNSGTPFLPGLSIKQQGRPLPGRPGTQNQGPGRVPLTPPPVSSGSSPPGQATGTTWPGNLWSQPEVINPDSGVSLYQPREPFQPYQPHDPNHPITVVDAPNMSSNQGGSPAGMPTSPLMPMGPPVHTSPSPPDMSPSESQMVADGGNPGPDAEDQISGRPQTGFPPQENVNVDSRLPDALPPFSDSSGRGKGSQEVADSHDGFEIPVSQQDHGISVIHEGQQIPFSHHSQHTPEIHEVQQIPVSHQGHTKPSNDHGQRIPTSHTDQMPFIHQGQKPTSHHGQQSTGSPKGQQTPLYNEGQHTLPQQNPENRNEQDRITEEKPNFPVAPTQPAETQPRPVRPTDSLPSSQGPVPPKESLDDLINLLYAAEAEIQHQMQDTLVTTPSTNTPDETLPVDPSSSVSFDSTASASVPDVGVSIRPEITHVPPDTVSSTTVRSTTSTTSKSISTSTTTRTATTKTTSTTPTTTTTARESNNRQDLPPDMLPPQLGKGVTVVQERPPDFHKESVEPNQVPPTLHPEDHSQPESFPPDGEREPGQRIPESENTNLPPLLNNPSFTDSIPTGSQTASRYRPGVVLPVDKSGEPLPGVRARVPPNNTQISPSRSIGRGGVPTIERVEQPSHRQHSDKTAVVQGVDLPEENISGVPEGKHKPPIPNTEFETSEVNAIDWYYSNYFREYDPYANLPVGGNEPPSGASTANVMYSTVILCMITLFYNQGHLL